MKQFGYVAAEPLGNAPKYFAAHPSFEKAFSYISDNQGRFPESGEYLLEGEKLKCIVFRGELKPEKKAKLESHRRYLDIQYVISGMERVGWSSITDCTPEGDYSSKEDLILYKEQPKNWLILEAGHFVIFCPGVAHAPMVGEGSVEKLVFKVEV